MPSLIIQFERVDDVWPDLERLAAQEQVEIAEPRSFRPDWESMGKLNDAGIFRVLTARVDDHIIGYFSWLMDFDMESKGTLIVNQGGWFVEPGHPIVAVKMLERAIAEFKKAGVEFAYFHHTVHGRGATVGRLFEKKGAKLSGHTYTLKLKGRREREG